MHTRHIIARAALDFGRVPRALPRSVTVADRPPLVIYDVNVGVSVEPPVRPTEVLVPPVDLTLVETSLASVATSLDALLQAAGRDGEHRGSRGKAE